MRGMTTGWLIMRAFAEFIYMDVIGVRGFRTIERVVRRTATRHAPQRNGTLDAVVEATDTAAVVYGKTVYCLQRSAVITRLLRRRGIPAELVIGYQMRPLAAHAWVEVDGQIVGREHYELAHFQVLDRW